MKLPKNFGGNQGFGEMLEQAKEAMARAQNLEEERTMARAQEIERQNKPQRIDPRAQKAFNYAYHMLGMATRTLGFMHAGQRKGDIKVEPAADKFLRQQLSHMRQGAEQFHKIYAIEPYPS